MAVNRAEVVAFIVGLVAGFAVGWRAGVHWVPVVLGRIATLALREDIRKYRRRRR
jgi:hypothetical protein